jgi:hypothetical protein
MKKLSSSNRILVWGGGGVVALLVVAGILNATRATTVLDPTTPEGVVQLFVTEILDGNEREARQYLSDELREECETEFFFSGRYGEFTTVALVETSFYDDGDGAEVEVTVTEGSYGLLDSYSYSHEGFYSYSHEGFQLERTGTGWLITNGTWPWWGC